MLPPEHFIENLALARRWRHLKGDIVECGTWRGGVSAAIAIAAPGHHSVLFDSFEGLPEPKPVDGPSAIHWSAEVREYDNCSADEKFAHAAMARANVQDYEIIKGWFEDTVPKWATLGRSISILRLDGDWYDSTMVCLQHLFPLVSPGGVIIVDDYFVWDGCARAVHAYLVEVGGAERLRSTPHDVAYICKGSTLP